MPEDQGYLAAEIKIVDEQAREDVARFVTDAQAKLGVISKPALSVTQQMKLLTAATQEAHARFGVMANATVGLSTAMRLLGIESGMAAVESGRLVLYFGRAITSGGGVAAMFRTIGVAIKGVLVSIGPVGWAIWAVTIAWAAFAAATKHANDATEEAAKKQEKLNEKLREFLDLSEKTRMKIGVERGEITSSEARSKELQKQFTVMEP